MTRDNWQFELVQMVGGEHSAYLPVKFVAVLAFVDTREVPGDNTVSLCVNLDVASSFSNVAENVGMSTLLGIGTKSPLPLLPVNHCIQDNSVLFAADARGSAT
jgi:hypothetical protein